MNDREDLSSQNKFQNQLGNKSQRNSEINLDDFEFTEVAEHFSKEKAPEIINKLIVQNQNILASESPKVQKFLTEKLAKKNLSPRPRNVCPRGYPQTTSL